MSMQERKAGCCQCKDTPNNQVGVSEKVQQGILTPEYCKILSGPNI